MDQGNPRHYPQRNYYSLHRRPWEGDSLQVRYVCISMFNFPRQAEAIAVVLILFTAYIF